MFVLFFLLWILMAGELSMHTCLWGLAASALMTWFCRKVLDYRWKLGRITTKPALSISATR